MRLIVNCDVNWGIGKDGKLLIHIREDMRRFRMHTEGKTVILGRKTLETFPEGKPLKNRRNIILSRNPGLKVEGAEVCTAEGLPALLEGTPSDEIYVIGGAEIYGLLLDQCNRAYVTKLDTAFEADTFFPKLAELGWRNVCESEWEPEGGVRYRFCEYVKPKA